MAWLCHSNLGEKWFDHHYFACAKNRNIMIVYRVNCGKSFILGTLCNIYKASVNLTTCPFVWVGVKEAEIIFWNNNWRIIGGLIELFHGNISWSVIQRRPYLHSFFENSICARCHIKKGHSNILHLTHTLLLLLSSQIIPKLMLLRVKCWKLDGKHSVFLSALS